MIRNYLGFPRGVSGQDLAARAADQALQFGAQFVYTQSVTGLRAEGRDRVVTLSDGSEITSRTVVLATGVAYRRLAIPALERLVGKGVFYGAVSEAQAMRGEEVFVVGAGNSAGQAALHLAEYAARVTILVRGDSLADSMSAYLIDELAVTPNVEIRVRTTVEDGRGEHRLEGLVLKDQATGQVETVSAAALFVLIGAEPRTDWLDGTLERDDRGYILTCRDLPPATSHDANSGRGTTGGRSLSRRVCRGSSPSVTSGTTRSSGWPRRWGPAPWPSSPSTPTWLKRSPSGGQSCMNSQRCRRQLARVSLLGSASRCCAGPGSTSISSGPAH